jgi:hypothetical protein
MIQQSSDEAPFARRGPAHCGQLRQAAGAVTPKVALNEDMRTTNIGDFDMGGMGKFIGHNPNGIGLANTAILGSLFDYLITKQILKPVEVVGILESAHHELSSDQNITSVSVAMGVVSNLTRPYREIEP